MKGKLSSSHTSLIPNAEIVYGALRQFAFVKKVGAGQIKCTNNGPARLKVMEQTGAILVKVRDQRAVQEVRIYGDHKAIKDALIALAAERGWKVETMDEG